MAWLVVAAAIAAGCAGTPQPTPELSPTAVTAPRLDQPIALPETIGISFRHPRPASQTEHQILYTLQQSLRAQLHAEYGPGASDPLLGAYWSGSALAAVRREVSEWTDRGEQPVGVLDVTQTSYSFVPAGGPVTVSYCASWADVARGNATTHLVGSPVQKRGTAGTYTALTVVRATDGRWRVTDISEVVRSPACRPAKQ
jgi:hypothetical protein